MNEITPNATPEKSQGNARAARIEKILREQFAPTQLDLRDESHLHAGHNAEAAHGGTHFRLTIAGPAFATLSRVEQQRLVNRALADEFATGLHALALTIVTR